MRGPGLYPFFRRHVLHGFGIHGLNQPPLVDYVSDLLARFARVSAVFPFRDTEGRPIETIAGLLVARHTELDSHEHSPRHIREQLFLHHLADYALFMSGLFRDRLRARGQLAYYREHGQGAFARCARLEANSERARVYRQVGREFGQISDALDEIWHQRLPLTGAETSPLAALWRA